MRLPVCEIEGDLRQALAAGGRRRVLLKAPTGSGKSTLVPGMVADELGGRVVVIEPRRMAARMLASWVARQRGTALGGGVGYAVRFDSRFGRDTQIVFVTDGVFQRWLQDDPQLGGTAAVVFDEFHERRLAGDLALAHCLDLQDASRPDLAVVVMSATLEVAGLADYLAPAAMLEAAGRRFPVEVVYRAGGLSPGDRRGAPVRDEPVWERVTTVCREALAAPDAGHVLVFLPGTYEIHKTIGILEAASWARGWEVFPLHSGLPVEKQEAAVAPSSRPKVIVATNVAETSLTIEGVRTVVDSGLARVAAFDPRRGIDTLRVEKISQAAAEQRAGRAGRTAPGRCYRLWSQAEHARRAAFETPEVRRVDLAEACLWLKAGGVDDLAGFRWLDAPEPSALARAEHLLHDLGALDASGQLLDEGRQMASLPLAPRFARLLLAGIECGCPAEAAFVAAVVEGEGVFAKARGGSARADFAVREAASDFAGEWRAFVSAEAMGFDPHRCGQVGILARGARETAQALERLRKLLDRRGVAWCEPDFVGRREQVGRAMLATFSDRLGIRLGQATLACRVVGQRKGKLDEESVAGAAGAFVAAEMTEVEGRELTVHLSRATAIELAWLREMFPADVRETSGAAWDEPRRRVVGRREVWFRDLLLESTELRDCPVDAAAVVLADHVVSDNLVLKKWDDAVEQWIARLACLSAWMPELELPGFGEDDRRAVIEQLCHGEFAYKDIKDREIWPVLHDWLSAPQRAALDFYAPVRVELPGGRHAKVTYAAGAEPWIGARVQHLFGVRETPRIAGGKVPVLVHVLAPNQRPWQVTKDLASFWTNGYPQMRKDLAGRYPRHDWPLQA